jgi:ATP-dependent Clp protease adapter protein ClpS
VRIHLISPTHYNRDGSLHKTTRYWTSGLTLPYLKALTPAGHDVSMVDELFYDVDLDTECDVVGITAMGPQIRRAYDLADEFRRRGRRVVLGGTWVSLTPQESLEHADAVVVGEAEQVWPGLLADFSEGLNRGTYRAEAWHSLENLPRIDYTSLPLLKYDAYKTSWLYRMVWNDPINLMAYVTFVLQKLFGYPREVAEKLMLQVHYDGRAVVSSGPREKAELDVFRLHEHGLWATMQQD